MFKYQLSCFAIVPVEKNDRSNRTEGYNSTVPRRHSLNLSLPTLAPWSWGSLCM